MVVLCGIDWAEHHHDVAIVDAAGEVVTTRRISDDITGFTQLTELLCAHAERPADVQVALETDRGLLVAALRAAGYRVFAINPKAVDRYRDRYAVSGAKSDAADALVLANLLRTDAARHRELANDSAQVEAIAVVARAHQDAVRVRLRDTGRLRSLLREFFPAALIAFPNLATKTAMQILAAAPTPSQAQALDRDQIRALLGAAGRICLRASDVERLHQIFAAEQLHQPPEVEEAMGVAVRAIVTTLMGIDAAIAELEAALAARFDNHPAAEILRSLPGLGVVLGGRVLGEFGDDPTRFLDAASRRRYAGTAPVTRASGKSRVVLLRRARNQRLADACRWRTQRGAARGGEAATADPMALTVRPQASVPSGPHFKPRPMRSHASATTLGLTREWLRRASKTSRTNGTLPSQAGSVTTRGSSTGDISTGS